MIVQFSAKQARIIGVLLEKEVTTPDQYPLSLNGLISACNQKSNREPVMNLSDTDVQNTVDELVAKKQIAEQSGFGSRVVKYKHRFCNTEFGDLKLDQQQLAVICVLLLRGPQTPGEIRTRTNRLAEFNNVDEVEQVLEGLREHNGEQLVIKLAREPGKRESRYQHCFTECGISKLDDSLQAIESSPSSSGQDAERIAALEQQVAQMRQQIAQLQECVNELIGN